MNHSGKVFLCRLFEKQSKRGNRYFAGRLGGASVVMFKDEHGDTENCWQVFVQEPPEKPVAPPPAPPRAEPQAPAAVRPRRRSPRKLGKRNQIAELVGDWQPPDDALQP